MPISIRNLVYDCADQHHPLARGVDESELLPLAELLQARFAQAGRELDFSSESPFGDAIDAASAYAQRAALRHQQFRDEDHLQIVREIVGYLGHVLVTVGENTWSNEGDLGDVEAEDRTSRITFITATEERTLEYAALNIGVLAADIWSSALSGSSEPPLMIIRRVWDKKDSKV